MKKEFDLATYVLTVVFPNFKEQLAEEKTQKDYEYAVLEFFKEYPEYSYENCCLFFEDLKYKKKKSHSTCVKKKGQLSSIFNYMLANLDKYTELPSGFENFFAQVPLKANAEVIEFNRVISISELDKLIGYTKENDPLCMFAILFSFKMMMRISSFIKLSWDLFDEVLEGRPLRAETPTGPHYLKMPSDIVYLLHEYMNQLPSRPTYIFSSKNQLTNTDKHLTDRALRKKLDVACQKSEIKYVSFNDLRNAGISYAVSNGCPIDVLCESLNKKSIHHIDRLTSLNTIKFTSAADYTNIIFTGNITPDPDADNL